MPPRATTWVACSLAGVREPRANAVASKPTTTRIKKTLGTDIKTSTTRISQPSSDR